MQDRITLGMNRTGLRTSPMEAEAMLSGLPMQEDVPMPEIGLEDIRAQYLEESEPVGSMPPPTTLKGVVGTVAETLSGNRLHVLLDKIGERAAYERSGTRLYDAMLQRLATEAALPEGMTRELVEEIRDEEARHFALCVEAIEKLGGDPTLQTPCADLAGVQGMGLMQAINDPRATLSQALQTLLAAEVIDVASWELLIELATQLGRDELVTQFTDALTRENEHVARVTDWLRLSLQADLSLSGDRGSEDSTT